jgi:hypothetical protein
MSQHVLAVRCKTSRDDPALGGSRPTHPHPAAPWVSRYVLNTDFRGPARRHSSSQAMSPRETSAPTRGEERRAEAMFVSHGGGYHGHPNPLPLSAHSVSREVLYSFAPRQDPFLHSYYGPIHNTESREPTRDRSGSPTRRDIRTMLDWCQDASDGNPCLPFASPARGPAGSAIAAGRPHPALAVAPQPALCEGWSAAGTLVRKTSRVDHAAARWRRPKHA